MYFLVDFENVLNGGLKGAQYLKAGDTVILFYSQVCEQIQQGLIHQIMDSGCCLEICKLKKQGKVLYLDSLKTFGKKDGLEIYRMMRRLTG